MESSFVHFRLDLAQSNHFNQSNNLTTSASFVFSNDTFALVYFVLTDFRNNQIMSLWFLVDLRTQQLAQVNDHTQIEHFLFCEAHENRLFRSVIRGGKVIITLLEIRHGLRLVPVRSVSERTLGFDRNDLVCVYPLRTGFVAYKKFRNHVRNKSYSDDFRIIAIDQKSSPCRVYCKRFSLAQKIPVSCFSHTGTTHVLPVLGKTHVQHDMKRDKSCFTVLDAGRQVHFKVFGKRVVVATPKFCISMTSLLSRKRSSTLDSPRVTALAFSQAIGNYLYVVERNLVHKFGMLRGTLEHVRSVLLTCTLPYATGYAASILYRKFLVL